MHWASPGKRARWDMAARDELRNDQKLPLAEEAEADTEVDLEPSHVRAFTPRSQVDLSVAVMQALRTLTAGYDPSPSAIPNRSAPSARR